MLLQLGCFYILRVYRKTRILFDFFVLVVVVVGKIIIKKPILSSVIRFRFLSHIYIYEKLMKYMNNWQYYSIIYIYVWRKHT